MLYSLNPVKNRQVSPQLSFGDNYQFWTGIANQTIALSIEKNWENNGMEKMYLVTPHLL